MKTSDGIGGTWMGHTRGLGILLTFRQTLIQRPGRRLARQQAVKPALKEANHIGMPRRPAIHKARECLCKRMPRLHAKGFAGSKPKESITPPEHAIPDAGETIMERMVWLEGGYIQDFLGDKGTAPAAMPPELDFGDGALGLVVLKKGQRIAPALDALIGVNSAKGAVEHAPGAPGLAQARAPR